MIKGENKGIYEKYIIISKDGKSLSPGRRFVLSLDLSDSHHRISSCKALSAYADSIYPYIPELAFDLWGWAGATQDRDADYENRLVEHRAWLKEATEEVERDEIDLGVAEVLGHTTFMRPDDVLDTLGAHPQVRQIIFHLHADLRKALRDNEQARNDIEVENRAETKKGE